MFSESKRYKENKSKYLRKNIFLIFFVKKQKIKNQQSMKK